MFISKVKYLVMLNILFLFLCLSFAFPSSPEEAQQLLSKFSNETNTQERLDFYSKIFLGLPYGKNGPLGEGPEGRFDRDPLYRFDLFDCTTYVETVVALALSRTVNEFENNLDKIRYEDGDVDYLKRNHFTDLQWIPFNTANGYMSEINQKVFPPEELKTAQAIINFPNWLKSHKIEQIIAPLETIETRRALLEELKSLASQYKQSVARVSYISIKSILLKPSLLNSIPSGAIINFVRPNWDLTTTSGTHQNISHQGFIFRNNKIPILRHATITGKVEEISLVQYLKKFENHPTLKGIHLMTVN